MLPDTQLDPTTTHNLQTQAQTIAHHLETQGHWVGDITPGDGTRYTLITAKNQDGQTKIAVSQTPNPAHIDLAETVRHNTTSHQLGLDQKPHTRAVYTLLFQAIHAHQLAHPHTHTQ